MTSSDLDNSERRPIRARGARWVSAVVRLLDRAGFTPNSVSVASVAFSVTGGVALCLCGADGWREDHRAVVVVLLACTPVWIGLRSLCNLFDGMLALEHGRGTRSGIVFNEFPDRVSDVVLLASAGVAVSEGTVGLHLGWGSAAVALTATYVRVLGASCGRGHDFGGPMAKPQRMLALAVGSVAAAIEFAVRGTTVSLGVALGVIALGGLLTIVLRLVRLIRGLEAAG